MLTNFEIELNIFDMWMERYTNELVLPKRKEYSLEEKCESILLYALVLEPNTQSTLDFLIATMNHIFTQMSRTEFKTDEEYFITSGMMQKLRTLAPIDNNYLSYLRSIGFNILFVVLKFEMLIRETRYAIHLKR